MDICSAIMDWTLIKLGCGIGWTMRSWSLLLTKVKMLLKTNQVMTEDQGMPWVIHVFYFGRGMSHGYFI